MSFKAALRCTSHNFAGGWKTWYVKYNNCFCYSGVTSKDNCHVLCDATYMTVSVMDDISSCRCIDKNLVGGKCNQRACYFDQTSTLLCREGYGRVKICDHDTPLKKRDSDYPRCECMNGGVASANYCSCKSPYTGKLCEDLIATQPPLTTTTKSYRSFGPTDGSYNKFTTTNSTRSDSDGNPNSPIFTGIFILAVVLFLVAFIAVCIYQRRRSGFGVRNPFSMSMFRRAPATNYAVEQRQPMVQPQVAQLRPARPSHERRLLPGHIEISYESTYPGQQHPHVHIPGYSAFPNNPQSENYQPSPQGAGSDAATEPSAPIAVDPHRNQTMPPLRHEIIILN